MSKHHWLALLLIATFACGHTSRRAETPVVPQRSTPRVWVPEDLPGTMVLNVDYRRSITSVPQEFVFVHERILAGACPAEDREMANELWFEVVCPWKDPRFDPDAKRALEAMHGKRPEGGKKHWILYGDVAKIFAERRLRHATLAELRAAAATLAGRHFERALAALGTKCIGPAWNLPSERDPINEFTPVVYEYGDGQLALNLDPFGKVNGVHNYAQYYCFLGVPLGP